MNTRPVCKDRHLFRHTARKSFEQEIEEANRETFGVEVVQWPAVTAGGVEACLFAGHTVPQNGSEIFNELLDIQIVSSLRNQ